MVRGLTIVTAALLLAADLTAAQERRPNAPAPPRRDRPAESTATGTARLAGRVIAADTGRPLKRARVSVNRGFEPREIYPDARVSRTAVTDENGRFTVSNLPAGKYSVSATKTGYVTMALGQRRALRPGLPIELADGQAVTNIDLRLPRGGVITGRIRDEDGEALARATVRVMRLLYLRGERQLVATEGDQTDDRGEYRVFGLPPGEYVISAVSGGSDRGPRRSLSDFGPFEPEDPLNYAPTYYPGVTSVGEAARVTVGAGQEQTGIDFSLILVPTARVRGVISGTGAEASGRVMVMLIQEELAGARRAPSYRAPVGADSTFAIDMVPPGRYLAVATAGPPANRLFAMQSVTVSGTDIDVTLTLAAGGTVSGTVRFEGAPGDGR